MLLLVLVLVLVLVLLLLLLLVPAAAAAAAHANTGANTGAVSHLVTSILDCTPVDGHRVLLTLVGSPVRGLGALMHAWSTWLGSGPNSTDGSFNVSHSV